MTFYCNNCSVPFTGDRCPVCRKKSARSIEPDDICFLTEKEQIWGGMLAEVLTQNGIPFIQKSTMGAGMVLRAGPMFERVRFYVYYRHLDEAKEIVEGLFSSAGMENDVGIDVYSESEKDQSVSTEDEYCLNAVSVEEMRRLDAATIAAGTPGKVLMRRAAEGIYNAWEEWPDGTLILCGSGNNGGDGFSLAEILSEQHISCRILTLSDRRTEDAAYYEQRAAKAGVPIQKYEPGCSFEAPLIVDCLLGTGFAGEVREPYASAIRRINEVHENGCRVISADINSGMNGDDGSGSLVVQSDLTVTIGLMKTGFFTEAGKRHYKELKLAEIGIIKHGE